MSLRRSNRLVARFEEAAREEAANARRGCGGPAARGRACAPQVPAPTAGRGRGQAHAPDAAAQPAGQNSHEKEDEEEVDEEIDAKARAEPARGGNRNANQQQEDGELLEGHTLLGLSDFERVRE
ncbi:hypothetical protein C2845_PM15G05140 [Panicum miliaceum]|uniref:Uncharacterized protein n=1 Tax=Panicum miliaceum TaxID=4540 RepID=A0A3L6Q6M9_PANMI|nr:hypothetical protein C2845_PM15G05140 [Panicum miliaceum]